MTLTSLDPEDILSASLECLYDYKPIIYSSANSLFTYTINDTAIVTLHTPDTHSRNWSLHASSIWVSSLHLADHIERLHLNEYNCNIHDRGSPRIPVSVLELGAGAGLPGIVVSKVYKHVSLTTTDYPDDLLIQTLSANVKQNCDPDRCRVVAYAWGSSDVSILLGIDTPGSNSDVGFDVIIAADTLWNSELHHSFIETLRMTLKKTADARIHLVAGLHTGRYTLQAFMDVVRQASSEFEFEEVVEMQVNGEGERDWSIAVEGEDERERRRWVVWMSLRWKQIALNPTL